MTIKNENLFKTLVISDLDGTLLNNEKRITEYTEKTLNRLIGCGMNFSIATARTAATVQKLLSSIHVNIPVILMNGVCVYDLHTQKYVHMESMARDAVKKLIDAVTPLQSSGFLYAIQDHELFTFYENDASPHATEFIRERKEGYGKVFTKVRSFYDCLDFNLVYYSVADSKENLADVYRKIESVNELRAEFYKDTYNEGYWYLEVCSRNASKSHAVEFLRKAYGFQLVFGFGDNLNDLPLFKACDQSFAVMNAAPEVKAKASLVIESNQEDGVAKWLEQNIRL
ncbi:MAG: HAD family hydrolase [Clostridia bacterium]|jgi:Cof subfamily protein (haloacid dehalogenase superfamily)|nr:Cof-type HAD-IIB family hydrolase [Clostridiaceae bacterium]